MLSTWENPRNWKVTVFLPPLQFRVPLVAETTVGLRIDLFGRGVSRAVGHNVTPNLRALSYLGFATVSIDIVLLSKVLSDHWL